MSSFSILLATAAHAAPSPLPAPDLMRELESTLRELLVATTNDSRLATQLENAKSAKQLQAKADRLAELSAQIEALKPGSLGGDRDPAIAMIARLFADQTETARANLRAGHRAYARELIQGMGQYCVSCHSRTNSGPSFRSSGELPELAQLSDLEQAQYFAAVRQFDRALSIYEKFLSQTGKKATYSPQWDQAARSSLALAVRVSQSPEQALKVVESILSNADAPTFLKAQAEVWKGSIAQWKKEVAKTAPATMTEDALFAEAKRLMEQGKKEQQYPADRSGDISFLRATAKLHDLLSRFPQGKRAPEALYLSGMNYQNLRDLGLWELHNFYFLGCIHQVPHSDLSRRCYREYEQNVFMSFSGSGGTHLPDEVRAELQTLSSLSAPLPVTTEKPQNKTGVN